MHGQPIHKTNLPLGTVNPMPATGAPADALVTSKKDMQATVKIKPLLILKTN